MLNSPATLFHKLVGIGMAGLIFNEEQFYNKKKTFQGLFL